MADNDLYAEFVSATYLEFLRREPDAVALKEKCGRLRQRSATMVGIIREILASVEFQTKLPEFLDSLPIEVPFANSQSQYGEIQLFLVDSINTRFGSRIVVDVGARGKARSNSYDLMKHFGWRGVLIEANDQLRSEIEEAFSGLEYSLICCAVSDFTGQATFTIGVNDDVSSLSSSAAATWGDIKGNKLVPVRRLQDILQSAGVPADFGLLSIDIEGEDVKVLNDIIANSTFRPQYVIIEASNDFSVKSLDDLPFNQLVKRQYKIVGQTRPNLILRRV